jgi:hypothetical protein
MMRFWSSSSTRSQYSHSHLTSGMVLQEPVAGAEPMPVKMAAVGPRNSVTFKKEKNGRFRARTIALERC